MIIALTRVPSDEKKRNKQFVGVQDIQLWSCFYSPSHPSVTLPSLFTREHTAGVLSIDDQNNGTS